MAPYRYRLAEKEVVTPEVVTLGTPERAESVVGSMGQVASQGRNMWPLFARNRQPSRR